MGNLRFSKDKQFADSPSVIDGCIWNVSAQSRLYQSLYRQGTPVNPAGPLSFDSSLYLSRLYQCLDM